ncbi:hypothetical protein PR003_g7599 [Phytophthora rubi]|uniref:Tc1-like transposase DDE domain-containing protein n=1 Tax=Phytophthora rubi TaxID=129364 RepID=A0A6A4FLF3_9STRA|nr:hypothetical protein PR002_g7547 [Phytophthora rubi]KAE9040287.1 hypothetical protein PR001_g7145 [Phytophthora rubi]KAE9346110.1 hypothetical protein PR003_g7599 [Phytophthora rubi]
MSETKAQLMKLVTPIKEKPIYQAQVTASLYDNYLLYTSPYYPELQLIELVWALVKGGIARDPSKNGNDAVQKVHDGLDAITRKQLIRTYRHVPSFEDEYAALAKEADDRQLMAAEDTL